MQLESRPLIGVATLIVDDAKLLLGYRKKSPGENSWQCPGGLLEEGESIVDCAIRETREETGLEINNLVPGPWTNNVFELAKFHSVTLYVTASLAGGILKSNEPDLAKSWAWFEKDKLPEPLFLPLRLLRKEQPYFWDSLF